MDWALPTVALALLALPPSRAASTGRRSPGRWCSRRSACSSGATRSGSSTRVSGEAVKLLAESTLALVLFGDASRIDLRALRGEVSLPARLLGIGLPLTLVAGFGVGLVLLGSLAWPEALLLAVILAPTDAALGQAVVTLPRLPSPVRQGLNVESGLNDGICVPLFFIALAIAQADARHVSDVAAFRLVAEAIGYGVVGGVIAGTVAAAVVVFGRRHRFVDDVWLQVVPVAAAVLAYSVADALGGSGFIAAFVGGMVFGGLRRRHGGEVGYLIEELGGILSAVTFIVFGAVMLGPALGDLTWAIAAYAVLSPHAGANGAGWDRDARHRRTPPDGRLSRLVRASRPRIDRLRRDPRRGGRAAARRRHHHHDLITIGLSVLAHGLTAAPLANRYAAWFESHPAMSGRRSRAAPQRMSAGEGRPQPGSDRPT